MTIYKFEVTVDSTDFHEDPEGNLPTSEEVMDFISEACRDAGHIDVTLELIKDTTI